MFSQFRGKEWIDAVEARIKCSGAGGGGGRLELVCCGGCGSGVIGGAVLLDVGSFWVV